MQLLFNQLQTSIKNADNILFVSHCNPDPDTIGGALALGKFAEAQNKNVDYFCANKIPNNFLFLKGAEKFTNKNISSDNYDLIIFIDCSEISRCGADDLLEHKRAVWINIDHHVDKERIVDLTIRDSQAAAACEIVYKFLQYADFFIDPSTASALLAGILIDTNFLSNSATKGESIAIASELSTFGADYRSILKSFYFNKNQEILKAWGLALSRLKYDKKKDITTTAIFKDDIGDDKDLNEAMEGFANFLNTVLKSNVVMVLREYDEGVRGNIRTSGDDVDVSKIAETYGGGGHRRAAGFMCSGRLVEEDSGWRVKK